MSEDYPLYIQTHDGRRAIEGYREWALDLAKSDAEELASITQKPVKVIDGRTGKVVAEVG